MPGVSVLGRALALCQHALMPGRYIKAASIVPKIIESANKTHITDAMIFTVLLPRIGVNSFILDVMILEKRIFCCEYFAERIFVPQKKGVDRLVDGYGGVEEALFYDFALVICGREEPY